MHLFSGVSESIDNPFIHIRKFYRRLRNSGQEIWVLLTALMVFLIFGIFIDGFLTINNLLLLARNVSVLGILGVGMAVVIIGRGIDLSQIACMAISTAWLILLIKQGVEPVLAVTAGLSVAMLCGLLNGMIIAFLEIPAIFVTLATNILIFGLGHLVLLNRASQIYLPKGMEHYLFLGQGRLFGIPMPILIFAAVVLLIHLFLTRVRYGYFISFQGDNDRTAALTGIPVRPLIILQYLICALTAYIAGLVYCSSIGGMDVTIATRTYIVEVILVVVLGGVSLAGGRGNMGSVVIGTLFIGTLTNGFTLLNVNTHWQDIIQGHVLLGAILLDNRLNPRSEEISRHGEDL